MCSTLKVDVMRKKLPGDRYENSIKIMVYNSSLIPIKSWPIFIARQLCIVVFRSVSKIKPVFGFGLAHPSRK